MKSAMRSRSRSSGGHARGWRNAIEAALHQEHNLPLQRLLCIAHQSGMAELADCAVTLQLLSTSRAVRLGVQRIMRPLGLSEARFFALVTLYTLDPEPSCPANLAHHAEITRTGMTDTLDQMEKQGWIRRERTTADRRVVHVHLTDAGREISQAAIRCFLKAAESFSESLRPTQQAVFGEVCQHLRRHAETM